MDVAEAIGHMMNKTKQVKSSSHKLSSVENSKPSSTRGSSSSPFAGVDLVCQNKNRKFNGNKFILGFFLLDLIGQTKGTAVWEKAVYIHRERHHAVCSWRLHGHFVSNTDIVEVVVYYNVIVGVKAADPSSLKFIYEHHPVFSALPTYGVITSWSGFYDVFGAGLQNVPLDLTKVWRTRALCDYIFTILY